MITGPAGAGKTTVAYKWAATRNSPCAHLSLDSFRLMVKSGYYDPELGWNAESQRQLELARTNIVAVAKNYLNAGVQVVVDDAVFPDWDDVGFERWKEKLSPIDIDLVVLSPGWNEVFDRNASRGGSDRLSESMLRTVYDDMFGWRDRADVSIIDNSNMTVAQTLTEIELALG
jgi:chloramphenicol 3-O-phosphotransferase